MMKSDFPEPECLADLPCHTGENPLWHPDEERIYWTDIPAATLHRCRADGTELASFPLPAPVGGFTLQEDGSLLLFMARGRIAAWRDGEVLNTLVEEIPGETDGRFNDVIADPLGGVFCGTMSTANHAGRFYHVDGAGRLSLLAEGMGTPNGMGFSPDLRWFYQNDSRQALMYRWEYDARTGAIGHRHVHLTVDGTAGKGRPDGMTVDEEGYLWTARWEGGRIVRHRPDGVPTGEILFPARNISSLTIGGPAMTTLFATSAACGSRTENGALAGSLFAVANLPVKGRPEFRSRVGRR